MDNFNFELLRIFLVVSKLKSFSRASDYLYVDQSTISKKIRQLENKFSITLFVRTAHGVELTVAGQAFKQQAQQLIDDFERLRESRQLSGQIFESGLLITLLLTVTHSFADHFAEFKLLKIENEGIKLVELFNNGELDVIIVNGSLADQIKGTYVRNDLTSEGFRVLAQASKINSRPCSLTDLYGGDLLIAPDYCPVSQQIMKYHAHFRRFKMVDYTATMIQLVRHSDFRTILPTGMVNYLTAHDTGLASVALTGFPDRKITAFAREQLVLDKVTTALAC